MTGLEIFFFGLLKAAVAGIAAGAVIYLLCLYWDDIVNWLQGRTSLKESDLDNIGFSLQEKLTSGGYKTVYGIFNTRTSKVLDATGVSSTKIDDRLSQEHRSAPLLVYR
jgi:hypothetical protein